MTRSSICLALSLAALATTTVGAQDQAFIYGKIHTDDGKVYQGAIRWGKEEVYWSDIFNASKEWNDHLRHLTERDRERLDDRNMSWYSWNDTFFEFLGTERWRGESNSTYTHQFACQFGEIKTVTPTGSQSVALEMRNGDRFEVDGDGYNDVGLDVRVYDVEVGEMEIYWNRIDRIEFLATPQQLENKFGESLYGTVEAFGTKFSGYIQWDHDERLSTDKLDGDSEDGDLSIPFGNIRSIERRGTRSLVVLKSGRELMLDGSNDVSSGHRGVIVEGRDFPAIDIPWDEFDKVIFDDKVPTGGISYADFNQQAELTGKVTAHNGDVFAGKIVYDLDETHTYELLQGKEGEYEYSIPFRAIKEITTKGEHRCLIKLKNGRQITLDESQDVGNRNHGILVFRPNSDDTKYLLWSEVSEVTFN